MQTFRVFLELLVKWSVESLILEKSSYSIASGHSYDEISFLFQT